MAFRSSTRGWVGFRGRYAGAAAAALTLALPALVPAATGWKLQAPPDPAGTSGAQFFSVSCPAATSCLAVGGETRTGAGETVLAEAWDGTAWRIVPASQPSGALQSYLSAVACASPRICEAVGQYESATGIHHSLAERWDGIRWSIVGVPDPSGAKGTELAGLACSSATRCIAVGDEVGRSGVDVPLAVEWNASAWTISHVAAPAGAAGSALVAVGCSGAAACTAVGQVEAPSGATTTLAERWDGRAWVRQAMPAPSSGITVDAVACPSATSCVAVGDRAVNPTTLVERWNGKSWTVTPVPAPGGNTGAFLLGVSCPSATWCVTTGSYAGPAGARWTLAYAWDGTDWARQTTRNSGKRFTSLAAVACSAVKACTAVGDDSGTGGATAPLAERSPA